MRSYVYLVFHYFISYFVHIYSFIQIYLLNIVMSWLKYTHPCFLELQNWSYSLNMTYTASTDNESPITAKGDTRHQNNNFFHHFVYTEPLVHSLYKQYYFYLLSFIIKPPLFLIYHSLLQAPLWINGYRIYENESGCFP